MTAQSDLHYRASGNPVHPPVLFLHGFLGSHADWEAVLSGLDQHFYCIAVDLPGHGLSHAGKDHENCFDLFASALLRLVDQLGLPRVALVGYSMGGRLALHTATRAPERFYALILESSSPGLREAVDRSARLNHDSRLSQQLGELAGNPAGLQDFLTAWYGQPIFQSLLSKPELLESLVNSRRRLDPRSCAAALEQFSVARQPSHWDALPHWTVPTLCIVGEHDHKFAVMAEEMSELSLRIAVESFAGCSHNVHLENPAGYTTALFQFLDSTWKLA